MALRSSFRSLEVARTQCLRSFCNAARKHIQIVLLICPNKLRESEGPNNWSRGATPSETLKTSFGFSTQELRVCDQPDLDHVQSGPNFIFTEFARKSCLHQPQGVVIIFSEPRVKLGSVGGSGGVGPPEVPSSICLCCFQFCQQRKLLSMKGRLNLLG